MNTFYFLTGTTKLILQQNRVNFRFIHISHLDKFENFLYVIWTNLGFLHICLIKLKVSPNMEKFQISLHDRCGEIWNVSTSFISSFSTDVLPQLPQVTNIRYVRPHISKGVQGLHHGHHGGATTSDSGVTLVTFLDALASLDFKLSVSVSNTYLFRLRLALYCSLQPNERQKTRQFTI